MQFLHGDTPSTALAVWAYVVPAGTMQYPVLLGRDSWTRLKQRSYRPLPRVPGATPLFGELDLHTDEIGPTAFNHNRPSSDNACFHLVYAGQEDVIISDEPQTLPVNLVRRTGHPAPIGNLLSDYSTALWRCCLS